MTQHTTGNRKEAAGNGKQAAGTVNNGRRMLTLLSILEDHIKDYNENRDLIGLSMWAEEAFKCMLYIERDNGL